MTETQKRYYLMVAEELSFSRAAKRLYVSQPAVSKNISMLEEELGFLLFDRTEKQIRLTEESEMFRSYLMRCQADFESTMEEIRQRRSGFTGDIRIGFVDTWSTKLFYDPIAAYFEKHHPNMKIQVDALGVDDMMVQIRRGQIDVGITFSMMVPDQGSIISKPFVELEAGLLYAGDGTQKKSLREFSDMHFILKEQGTEAVRKFITRQCHEKGFNPKFVYSRGAGNELTEVRHSNGALFCSEWHFWKEMDMLDYFPLEEKLPTKLIFQPGRISPAGKLFINEVEMLFASRLGKGKKTTA